MNKQLRCSQVNRLFRPPRLGCEKECDGHWGFSMRVSLLTPRSYSLPMLETLPRTLGLVGCAAALCVAVPTPVLAEPPRAAEEGLARFGRRGSSAVQRAVELPESPAAEKFAHILSVINGGKPGDATETFSPDFLEYISAEEIATELASVGEAFDGETVVPVEVNATEDRGDTLTATISSRSGKRFLTVFLLLNEDTNRVSALRIDPAGDPGGGGGGGGGGPADWSEFGGELDDLPGEVGFGAWALIASENGTQELIPVAGQNENTTLAIGSSFKLWVLGALAEDVLASKSAQTKNEGAAADDAAKSNEADAAKALSSLPAKSATSWDTTLAVQDALKSLPSGTLQLREAGSEITFADAASLMISISDNTATDHLLHALGRERVEAFMQSVNSTPERNQPMLSTREAFVLKLSADDGLLERYLANDEKGKRELLSTVLADAKPNLDDASDWVEPRLIDRVEWFASAHDCARTLARLRELELDGIKASPAGAAAPTNHLGTAMRKNPGISFDPAIWKSAAFKGGSEPGVLHSCWLLERSDGKWYVFSLGWNNEDELIDQDRFLQLANQGIDLLAKDGVEKDEKLPQNPAPKPAPERRPDKPREEGKPLPVVPKPTVRPT